MTKSASSAYVLLSLKYRGSAEFASESYWDGARLSAANLPMVLKRKTAVVMRAAKLTQPVQYFYAVSLS